MTQWGLDVLFNPAKRHMDEEKRRLQSTREEVGDASDGKRIDLTTGRVVIRRQAEPATEETDEAGDAATEDEAVVADAADSADQSEAAEDESDAS